MVYISSDTNVWIDFMTIGKLDIPFRLAYTYIMSQEAIEDELLSPPGLSKSLISYGLQSVEITIDEFFLAEEYGDIYRKLSIYDRMALAIAKCRDITLLTGDGALRKAAGREGVNVMGTLGVLDQLWEQHKLSPDEYEDCLYGLLDNNTGNVRLPKEEIVLRLNEFHSKHLRELE